jgi:PAS domain S-box-containing protein
VGVSREILENGIADEVRQLMSQNFAEPQQFLARIDEITATAQESFDILELKDGRLVERHSRILSIDRQRAARVWHYRDVTKRQLAEMASRQLAAIVASSDDAIIGKNLNSIITSWNAGAERIFGYTAEEMIGTSIMRLIPLDRQEEEHEILSRICRGERFDHFETIRLAKDGRHLNVSITISPIKDSTGRVIGAS